MRSNLSTPFLKVIAGIENFDAQNIQEVAQAADGVAAAIDLSTDEASVRWVKENTQLTIFVSSLEPKALAESVDWGTDWVELGNFQPLYDRGALINPDKVMTWTQELVELVKGKAGICVTIPGILSVEQQVELAQQIEQAGADMLQIENMTGDLSHVQPIRQAVSIPVMVSGKLTPANFAASLQAGVAGYGVGKAIRDAGSVDTMKTLIGLLQNKLQSKIAQV